MKPIIRFKDFKSFHRDRKTVPDEAASAPPAMLSNAPTEALKLVPRPKKILSFKEWLVKHS